MMTTGASGATFIICIVAVISAGVAASAAAAYGDVHVLQRGVDATATYLQSNSFDLRASIHRKPYASIGTAIDLFAPYRLMVIYLVIYR